MQRKVYVVGGDALVSAMFELREFKIADALEEADFVVFTGGADVPPKYYGENALPCTYCIPWREEKEQIDFFAAKSLGIPMIGICRGGQFLHVLNGGEMWQDVTGHGIHGTHPVYDLETGETHECTSTHHQMMRLVNGKGELVAHGGELSTHFISESGVYAGIDASDVEVVWYADTKSLCFQPHPEYGVKSCEKYFFELVARYYG